MLKFVAAVPLVLGSGTAAAALLNPPQAAAEPPWLQAFNAPGETPNIISRADWGADESLRAGAPVYDNGIRAGIVHHTAGNNDYAPEDSARIVREIYAALPAIVAHGMSAIVVEQDVQLARRVSSRFYCLQEGRVSLTGVSAEVSDEAITQA